MVLLRAGVSKIDLLRAGLRVREVRAGLREVRAGLRVGGASHLLFRVGFLGSFLGPLGLPLPTLLPSWQTAAASSSSSANRYFSCSSANVPGKF